jgi:hypothetical protein
MRLSITWRLASPAVWPRYCHCLQPFPFCCQRKRILRGDIFVLFWDFKVVLRARLIRRARLGSFASLRMTMGALRHRDVIPIHLGGRMGFFVALLLRMTGGPSKIAAGPSDPCNDSGGAGAALGMTKSLIHLTYIFSRLIINSNSKEKFRILAADRS